MNHETFTKWREQFRRSFADHRLEVVIDEGPVRAYWLRRPGSSPYSVFIVAGPTGISLSGDTSYGDQHEIFARKPLDWFCADYGHSSEGYRAIAFQLRKRWDGEAARDIMGDWVNDLELMALPDDDGIIDADALLEAEKAAEALDDIVDWDDEREVRDAFHDILEEVPGYDYSESAVAILCVVQETFARLYRALKETTP